MLLYGAEKNIRMKKMNEVTLKYDMPFCFRSNWTFYKTGQKLRLIEAKEIFFDSECKTGYKVAYNNFEPFDGYCRADAFEEYTNKEGEPR